ncbi:MAG: hypothetical protein ACI97A_003081 [Planctomycetota bacterium]|jgi:hypothetical protein
MVREDLKKRSSKKGKFFGFLLINILPIGGMAALIWGLNQGKISLDDLPGGIGRNTLYCGISIALLIISASLLLPMVHGIARHFRTTLGWSAELRSKGGALRRLWEYVLWLPRQLSYRVSALLRLTLVLVSFALILCAVVFMIRFLNPDLLEEQLQITERMSQLESSIRSYRW